MKWAIANKSVTSSTIRCPRHLRNNTPGTLDCEFIAVPNYMIARFSLRLPVSRDCSRSRVWRNWPIPVFFWLLLALSAMLAKEENVLLPDCIADHAFANRIIGKSFISNEFCSKVLFLPSGTWTPQKFDSGHRILENHLNHWSSASGSFNISAAEGVREGSVVKTHTS